MAVVGWLLLSLALFIISAQIERGKVPNSAKAALTSGPNMLTSTDTVLILGTDQRPKGSKEPGANTNDAGSRSDTIMLWRIGGGTSRRLSIPRDTVVPIPGHGDDKINAAYAYGGPALAIKTVEEFARNEGVNLKINHLIIVNLAAFPDFINAIGGVDVKTGRVCSEISGGVEKGGFTLNLRPGTHHLNGVQALVRTRARARTGAILPTATSPGSCTSSRSSTASSRSCSPRARSSGCRGRHGTRPRCCARTWAARRCCRCSRPQSLAARRRPRY